jgi:hypothetical protein
MDFLVNFYQFSADFLTLDRIRRIVSLVKYIDWVNLAADSQSPNTRAVAEIANQAKIGSDNLTMSIIAESQSNLTKQYVPIMGYLRILVEYRRELYKLELRESVTSQMPPEEASQIANIKRKFGQANTGQPFYPDLAEEVIKEDYSNDGQALRDKVLTSLMVADAKPKTAKAAVNFKTILVEGLNVICSVIQALTDIMGKMDENRALLENRKRGFWDKVKQVFQQMFNKGPESIFYEISYMDPVKNVPVRET